MDVVIGQGFLQVTPLQLARSYMITANEGLAHPVHLVSGIESPDGSIVVDTDRDRSSVSNRGRPRGGPSKTACATSSSGSGGRRNRPLKERRTIRRARRVGADRDRGARLVCRVCSGRRSWRLSSSSLPNTARAALPLHRLPGKSWMVISDPPQSEAIGQENGLSG